jgi:beta-lactamase regulating signal transducer with metallopeptidase domain
MTINHLGWALIHSLWQCTAVALLYGILSLLSRRAGANTRYLAAYLSLLAMPVAFIATLLTLNTHAAIVLAPSTQPVMLAAGPLPPATPVPVLVPWLAIVVWIWLTGVISMSVWSAAGWAAAQRLKRRGKNPLPEIWQQRVAVVATRLQIRRRVRLYQTAFAQVPAVIGWIRPVILIPAGALLNLTPQQLEAIIAHELAHVRRHDYLANLLQSAIEVAMFYHPAIWWIGKRIRAEREHCCDDLAIAACGDRILYARALTALEELRCPQFAMAATGGSLATRIRRLLGRGEPQRRSLPLWIAIATLLIAFVGVRAHSSPAPVHVTPHLQGYLAGLVDADYTNISVDEIIDLKNNGIAPEFIKGILHAGLGTPSPKTLIHLHNNGLTPEYAREAAAARIADLDFDRLVPLKQNGVNVEALGRIHSLGFGPFTTSEAIDLQRHGALRPDLFAALKESGYTKLDAHQAIAAQNSGLSPDSLRNLRAQKFTSLTFEQLLKLKRAGVI